MNALLAVVADFLEHATDPVFGREVNDDYNFKFHVLMSNDTETAERLATARLDRDDARSMSAAAWLWYLTWRDSVTDEQPSAEFMAGLYDETENPVLRLRITALSLSAMSDDPQGADTAAEAEVGRRAWVWNRVRDLLQEQDLRTRDRRGQAPVDEAWELLSYLIDIGTPASLRLARDILAERAPGSGMLREKVSGMVGEMQLPEETQIELISRLGLW